MSLGCPSVARRRSRRRLRNDWTSAFDGSDRRGSSMSCWIPRRQADSRTTRSAVSPSGATDGHPRWLEGLNKSLPARREWLKRILDVLPDITMRTIDIDRRCRSRHHDGVIDPSLQCPSGARQSPGGEADGDCGTLDVSLQREWSTWIVDVPLPSTPASRLDRKSTRLNSSH